MTKSAKANLCLIWTDPDEDAYLTVDWFSETELREAVDGQEIAHVVNEPDGTFYGKAKATVRRLSKRVIDLDYTAYPEANKKMEMGVTRLEFRGTKVLVHWRDAPETAQFRPNVGVVLRPVHVKALYKSVQ